MKKLTTAMFALAAGAAAMADTVTYTDWDPAAGYNDTAGGTTGLSYNSAFTVPKFNPGLGTLTKVSWYVWAEVQGNVTVQNTGDDEATVEYTFGSKFTTTEASLGILSVINLSSYSSPVILLGGEGGIPGSGDTDTSPTVFADDDAAGQTVNALVLPNWQGAGDVVIPLLHENKIFLSTTGNMESQFDQYGRSRIEVTYHYDTGVVPEPGTYVGGLALLGIGGLAYRRMRRSA